jgi:hypothetical protein
MRVVLRGCEGEGGRTRKGRARNLVVKRVAERAGAWQRARAGRLTPPACLEHDAGGFWNWSILVQCGESAREHERVNLLKLPSCLPIIQDNTYTLTLADSSTEPIAQLTDLFIFVCSSVNQSG